MIRTAGISTYQDIEGLRGRKDPEAVRLVAKEMEALFAYELIKAMREASQESSKGLGSSVYTSLFDMELARMMADRGLGLQEQLINGLRVKGLNEIDSSTRVKSEQGKTIEGSDDSERQNGEGKRILEKKGQASPPADRFSGDGRMPVNGRITSGFGMRVHPIHHDLRFHHGIDIAAEEGTDIYPVRQGRVVFSGEQRGYGNIVVIEHDDGYITKYAHNKVNLVKAGDYVDSNTVIAKVGSTGLSTGPHLHFEVRFGSEAINPVTFLSTKEFPESSDI